ncbi:MAG: YbaB/EbfC family nucleoid-associated protein [Clostridia bacterium]
MGYRPSGFGGFGGGNIGNLMKQAQKMQEDLQKVKKEISQTEFVGKSGGGMVEVVLLGGNNVKQVKLQKQIVDPEDVEMLEDLILAAFNDAYAQFNKTQAEKIPFGEI